MNYSDPLLRSIARVAREDATAETTDSRWEALARGELSATEEAQIRELARTDPEVARMYEAFQPLTDAMRARIADNLTSTGRPHVAAKTRHPWKRGVLIVLPLALAAGVALWAHPPSAFGVSDGALALRDAPPADYTLSVTGGDRRTRGTEPRARGSIDMRRDSELEFVLRPKTPTVGHVATRGYLFGDAETRAWKPSIEVSSDGAMLLEGRADELLGVSTGAWDAVLVVGREGELPTDTQAVKDAIAHPDRARRWQVFVTHVAFAD